MRKAIPATVFVVCISFLLGYPAYSQGFGAVDEAAAGNFFVVGARALAMGGAHIAVSSDATALVYNPAGLARVTRIEFSGGLTHQRLDSETRRGLSTLLGSGFNNGRLQSNTRFGSANVVLPVPTYRGSLVLALGVNRVQSFDKVMEFGDDPYLDDDMVDSGIESQSGGLYLWSFGAAVDVSPNVSVGGTVNYWRGKSSYTWLFEKWLLFPQLEIRYDDAIDDRYSGFNAKFGVRIQPNKYLVLGGTIDSPVTLTIEEDWTEATDTIFHAHGREVNHYGYWSSEYKVTLPFSLGAGMALHLNNLTLAGDISYTDWTQMEYKRYEYVAEANRLIKETYSDALRFHLGAEYLIPQLGTSLRAGFYQDPLPYKSRWVTEDRSFFTAGVGFLIDQVMTLDIAWAHGSWELYDLDLTLAEKYTSDRIFVSVAYRL